MSRIFSTSFVLRLAPLVALAACPPPPPPADQPDGGSAACVAPTGFETVEAVDGAGAPPGGYRDVSLALSQYDEPMLAYAGMDGGDGSSSALYFTMWDRGTCTWRTPVVVGTVGNLAADNVQTDIAPRELKLVQDGVSQHLAIAYQHQHVVDNNVLQDVMLAQSSDLGATWRTETIASPTMANGADDTDTPTVGFEAGWTFVAYFQAYSEDPVQRCGSEQCSLVRLASRNGESGPFTDIALPPSSDAVKDCDSVTPDISVGLDLKPSVAFAELSKDDAVGEYVSYYTAGASHEVFDTAGLVNAISGVSLFVDIETPHLAASAQRETPDSYQDVWFASSADIAGTTWSAPAHIPNDGDKDMEGYLSLAISGGNYTIANDFSGADGQGTARCGGPNLSTSTDSGSTWSTCGADATKANSFAGSFVTAAYARTGKRVLAFDYTTQGTSLAPGLVVWREP